MTNELRNKVKQFEIKQIVAATLLLVIAVGAAVIVNTIQLNSTAKQSVQFVTRLIQFEDIREVELTLGDTRRRGFSKIVFDSSEKSRRFTIPPNYYNNPNSAWHDFVTSKITLPADDQLETGYNDSITYEYHRFRLVPYALIGWLLLVLVSIPQTRYMKEKLIEQFDKEMKGAEALGKAKIAREVRHNIRTPLAALMRVPSQLPDSVKEHRELLKSSIAQFRSIVSALDEGKNEVSPNEESPEIYDTVMQSLREISVTIPSRIEFTYEVEDAVVSALIPHIPHELRALLGNIVNNSVDAISGNGRITVTARDIGPEVQITIEDTGTGITPEILPHIFEDGFSSGKSVAGGGGTGIGLHHAKTWIEKWDGHICATSEPGKSTTILIRLPIEDRASWYIPRLKFSKGDRLIILDDQPSAHALWRMRLDEVGALDQARFASSELEAEKLIHESAHDSVHGSTPMSGRTHYLFDYDIRSTVTGLDMLGRLPNNGRRYLVTGHFDDADIRRRCGESGVYLLPKSELAQIRIVVV